MTYFFDTEFHEYQKKPFFGKAINTIELISIGIVSEGGETYYSICKEFDIKAAFENEWLRDNVLFPIYTSWCSGDMRNTYLFEPKWFKRLLQCHGKTRKEIAKEIVEFCGGYANIIQGDLVSSYHCETKPEFYAYYADYDWVVFCWLFGRMIDLPKGFPMYCKDLKQELDRKIEALNLSYHSGILKEKNIETDRSATFEEKLKYVKSVDFYPENKGEHDALSDAKWNKDLFHFIKHFF